MKLSQSAYDALVAEIRATLINAKTYNPDTNEEVEAGIQDMVEAEDEAERIVDKWMKDQKIELIEEPVNT